MLDNIQRLMNVMREANVTLRWMMLHTAALSPSESHSTLLQLFSHLKNVNTDCPRDCQTCLLSLTSAAEGNKRCRQLRDQVIADSKYHPQVMFRLMLNTAQYEFKLKEVISLGIWLYTSKFWAG